jgi:hypothetical protein
MLAGTGVLPDLDEGEGGGYALCCDGSWKGRPVPPVLAGAAQLGASGNFQLLVVSINMAHGRQRHYSSGPLLSLQF